MTDALALALMLLEPEDDVGIVNLAAQLEAEHPLLAAALRALLPLPAAARADRLAAARALAEDKVEEEVFATLPAALQTELVSHHRSALQELEGLALRLDGGEAGARPAAMRLCHGLKGDAGMVGLEGMVRRWHAVEGLLAEEATELPALASALFEAISRTEAELDQLSGRATPTWSPPAWAAAPAPEADPAPTAEDALAEPEPEGFGAVMSGWSPPAWADPEPAAPALAAPAAQAARDAETVEIMMEFLAESADGLAASDEILMRAEAGEAGPGDIDTLFRAFHSMKGAAGALDLEPPATLAHAMEDVLSRCRDGLAPFTGAVVGLLLDGTQLMHRLMEDARLALTRGLEVQMPAEGPAVIAALRGLVEPSPPAQAIVENSVVKVVRRDPVAPPVAAAPPEPSRASEPSRTSEPSGPSGAGPGVATKVRETVKVDLERVDLLVELVGELVIAEAMVAGRAEVVATPELRNALRHLTKIVRDLQRMGIGLRMVPLVGVFQRLRRLVRDLCMRVGKEARLHTEGEEIEMDRSLVEQLADPLMHILRNAMDHGLEAPAERRAAGKSPVGAITVAAAHEGGNIVIDVRDDGRGMNRARILQRAVERGLVSPGATLSDPEVYELVFAPGFSTAEQVTEVSGRGVGMDVVKRNVEAMGGRVRVLSAPGQGSTVRLTLPLTLAIIDGMLIGCGAERFVVPTRSIVESVRPTEAMLVQYGGRAEAVNLRGTLLPLVRLDRVLGLQARATALHEGLCLVLEGISRRFALLVDEVVSRQQVVIKAMDARLVDLRLYSGACILADGHAGLILNVDALHEHSSLRGAVGGAA